MTLSTALSAKLPGANPFEAISRRAERCNAINLGQGLPEFGWPDSLIEAARAALVEQSNQYPPSAGLPILRDAVARHYFRFQALEYDADEVVVTSGGTEALAATLLALVRPGDEVILVEPFYGAYLPLVERAGGTARVVRLEPPSFMLDRVALDASVSPRTRLILLNNPLNPFGVVLGDSVLETVAAFCRHHDLIAVCDEVWEHALLGACQFRPLASFAGMRERTVKIGAAGKIFSLTGWKVGWTCAPPALTGLIEQSHLNLTFATSPHLQHAVVAGLGLEHDYFEGVHRALANTAARLRRGLIGAGYAVLWPGATHFLNLDLRRSGTRLDDQTFCARLLDEWGVAAVPVSTFYRTSPPTNFVRLCFAKQDSTLDAAIPLLAGALQQARRDFPVS